MHLTPQERDKLLIFTAGELARARKARGLKLNHPEAVALITAATAGDGPRRQERGRDHERRRARSSPEDDVMEGVPR